MRILPKTSAWTKVCAGSCYEEILGFSQSDDNITEAAKSYPGNILSETADSSLYKVH